MEEVNMVMKRTVVVEEDMEHIVLGVVMEPAMEVLVGDLEVTVKERGV